MKERPGLNCGIANLKVRAKVCAVAGGNIRKLKFRSWSSPHLVVRVRCHGGKLESQRWGEGKIKCKREFSAEGHRYLIVRASTGGDRTGTVLRDTLIGSGESGDQLFPSDKEKGAGSK